MQSRAADNAPLQRLPGELFDKILSYLEAEPPSARDFANVPGLLVSDVQPLKSVSRTCRRFRELTFETIFSCLRCHGSKEVHSLCTFVHEHVSRQRRMRRVLICGSHGEVEPDGALMEDAITELLAYIDPKILTFALPPAWLKGLWSAHEYHAVDSTRDGDVPLQYLQLRSSEDSMWYTADIPVNAPMSERSGGMGALSLVHPWSTVAFNEGAFCPINEVPAHARRAKPTWMITHPSSMDFLENITIFEYTTCYSAGYHSLIRFLNLLPTLETLRVRLYPTLADRIALELPMKESDQFQVDGLWQDLRTIYLTIFDWISKERFREAPLSRLELLDFAVPDHDFFESMNTRVLSTWQSAVWARSERHVWVKRPLRGSNSNSAGAH